MTQNNRRFLVNNPQTVAWLVVSLSFVLFCVVCAASTFGAYWFFFESTNTLTASLTVSQGSISITYPDLTSETFNDVVDNPSVLRSNPTLRIIDTNSQGYLTFEDNYSKQIIATVFLGGNSTVRLAAATRPRFEWGRGAYTILLTGTVGRFTVDIPPGFSRPLVLNLQAAAGAARLSEQGTYLVDAADQSFKLHSRSGTGLLVAPTYEARQVEAGSEGTVNGESQQVKIQRYPFDNLIVDEIHRVDPSATLIDSFGDGDLNSPGLPAPWGCNNSPPEDQNEPEGSWKREQMDQRVVLHMYRGERSSKLVSHAETGCEMWFTTPGLDVSGYKSLRIRLRMKVQFQDVTTCGIRGSECPVMLLLTYMAPKDRPGEERVWRQGFYSVRPPDDTNLQTCDTCVHFHEQINLNSWYIYESVDFLKEFPDDKKPASLLRIRVYTSGHEFDVALSDLDLLAGR
jgi:hypothetical protein